MAGSRSDLHDEYGRRLDDRRALRAATDRRHLRLGTLRVAILAAGAATLVAAALGDLSPWWLIAPAAANFWVGVRLDAVERERARHERAAEFYERALARLDDRWAGAGGATGDRFADDTHPYASDLDLFGEGSLFELLNASRTRMGEDALAAWLKAPAGPEVVTLRQEAVRDLAPRLDLREALAVLGEDARTVARVGGLAAWAEHAAWLDRPGPPAWIWPLSAAGVVAVLGFLVLLANLFGVLPLEASTLVQVRTYSIVVLGICWSARLRFRRPASAIFGGAAEAAHGLDLLSGIVGRLEVEPVTAARLVALRAALDTGGEPASGRIRRLDSLVTLVDSREHLLLRLAGPLLVWDIHLAFAIERWRRTSGPFVRGWLDAVAEFEALSSLAGYASEHPGDVFPDVDAVAPCFDGEGLGHPLLPESVMVRNDVRFVDGLRVFIVSGSNMSGKSTLLRTVGVNAVLAQAGAPVRARRLRLSPLQVGASIRIQDSLQRGVSRFYAEITRLGLLVRRAAGQPPVLFLIDELLHGTNSHDRFIGAEGIIRGLVGRGAIGLVTTHDLALAEVVAEMPGQAANVHFGDTIEEGRMRFDYRLKPGVVDESNALALMRLVGLDV